MAVFPLQHWKKIQSTHPLERINRGVQTPHQRRSGLSLPPGALERRVTAVLYELHDKWIAFPRHYLPEGSMTKLYPELHEGAPAPLHTTNEPTE